MKTRLSAMAVAISSISMLTACGGGSGGIPSLPSSTPTPAPTVTVTATATASVGYAFSVDWSSTDATSCSSSDLTGVSAASGSVSQTETAAATKTYSVTCTGTGGSATGTATVAVDARPTAEGTWQGTTDDARVISGVVLTADRSSGPAVSNYWLAYTKTDGTTPAGFVAGTGISGDTTATSGAFTSNNLHEFNFDAGRVNASGTLTAPYVKKASLGTASATGSFTDHDSVTNPTYPLSFTVAASPESPVMFGADPTATPPNPGVPFYVTTTLAGTASLAADGTLTMSMLGDLRVDATEINPLPTPPATRPNIIADAYPLAQTFKFNTTTNGTGTYNLSVAASAVLQDATTSPLATDSYFQTTSCTDYIAADGGTSTFAVCGLLPFAPLNARQALVDLETFDGTYYNNQQFTWSGGNIKVTEMINVAMPFVIDYTLTPTGSAATTRTFSLAYSAGYESTPALAAVAGSYTAGLTGIDATMNADASLTVTSGGAITGAESVSHCNYSATIAPHATGNVYDVTALTFTSSGGTCVYAASGAFTGVATYDATAKKLTLTALDSTRSKGFMVVAAQP